MVIVLFQKLHFDFIQLIGSGGRFITRVKELTGKIWKIPRQKIHNEEVVRVEYKQEFFLKKIRDSVFNVNWMFMVA